MKIRCNPHGYRAESWVRGAVSFRERKHSIHDQAAARFERGASLPACDAHAQGHVQPLEKE